MDDGLAFRFFREFSLLEYALKKAGFVQAAGTRQYAKTHWHGFSEREDLAKGFDERRMEHEDLRKAVDYLRQAPPKYLRYQDEELQWAEAEDQDESLTQVLRSVRTVRNNLFHGDKASSMGETAVGRDECLVDCSLTVVEHCIELDEATKTHYEEESKVAS